MKRPIRSLSTLALLSSVAACGAGSAGKTGAGGSPGASASATTGSSAGGGTSSSSASSGGTGGSGGASAPTPEALLALLGSCNQVSNGLYKTDSSESATIPICGLTGAVFWQADMDIDCDGKTTAQCNVQADPDYQAQTSATDSHGDPLDSAGLPFVVVPLPSSRFSYKTAGLALGSVIAVLYKGKLVYAVFGDEGPSTIIGEASYATAVALGVDPDPSTGGTDSGVSYIAFTGPGAVVTPIEDHAGTVALGQKLAAKLLADN